MKKKINIAIDGPAGSGKSTIAKLVASKFGYIYIDTGAMYRAITLKALLHKISTADEESLTRIAEETEILLKYDSGRMRLFLDGVEVTDEIRSLEVTDNVSAVAAIPGVRKALVKLQQKMSLSGGVVMDGRDIGTVVLPHAELKIFLTASVEERSKRRWLELKEKGIDMDLNELKEQIVRRDYFDSHRETDPLCQASDAILMDTTSLSIDQVVRQVYEMAIARGAI